MYTVMKNASSGSKLPYHKTKVISIGNTTTVCYNGTNVVTIVTHNTFEHPNVVIKLYTGGWRSRTCKRRMNQASNQFGLGFRVYQHQNKWWVEQKTNNSIEVQEFKGSTLTLTR